MLVLRIASICSMIDSGMKFDLRLISLIVEFCRMSMRKQNPDELSNSLSYKFKRTKLELCLRPEARISPPAS